MPHIQVEHHPCWAELALFILLVEVLGQETLNALLVVPVVGGGALTDLLVHVEHPPTRA